MSSARVAMLGLGEAGHALADDLLRLGHAVTWHDIDAAPAGTPARHAAELGLPGEGTVADAVAAADLVISAVTPGACVAAATTASAHLRPGAWFVDLNSASPAHKAEAAAVVVAAGGRYVEAALMSAVEPRRLAAPYLLGGPEAAAFAGVAHELGFTDVTVVPGPVGIAAATKLCRSVVVKGMEALFTEALLAARRYGVEDAVLSSLPSILPEADWERIATYYVSRSLRHGRRRSEEMGEAAWTVREVGVAPTMALATADREEWAGGLGIVPPAAPPALGDLLDEIVRASGGDPAPGAGDDGSLP